MWVGIFEPREELVPWLTREKAKEPVKSSPSLGPTFPTYINLLTHLCAHITRTRVCMYGRARYLQGARPVGFVPLRATRKSGATWLER